LSRRQRRRCNATETRTAGKWLHGCRSSASIRQAAGRVSASRIVVLNKRPKRQLAIAGETRSLELLHCLGNATNTSTQRRWGEGGGDVTVWTFKSRTCNLDSVCTQVPRLRWNAASHTTDYRCGSLYMAVTCSQAPTSKQSKISWSPDAITIVSNT
jgi:hypothetical protein